MKLLKLLCLLACATVGFNASAGDTYIGTIAATAGPTTKDNVNTATPFVIPSMSKVSIQCDAAAYIATDVVNGATSTNGIKVSTDALFLTTVGARKSTISGTATAVISVIGASGAVNCRVFVRRGDE